MMAGDLERLRQRIARAEGEERQEKGRVDLAEGVSVPETIAG